MGKAIDVELRRSILAGFQKEESYVSLAARWGVSVASVRTICRRSLVSEEAALYPHYEACGRLGPNQTDLVYRASCFLKRYHPKWGAPFILVKLTEKYPTLPLPKACTLQYWFKAVGLSPKPKRRVAPLTHSSRKAESPHDIWQIDAKERVKLHGASAEKKEVCWLSIVDEYSGGALAASVFSPGKNR
jgi:hypothetical protein